MGVLGNVAKTLLNPKKFTEKVNDGLQEISSQKNSSPSDVASDTSTFIYSAAPGTQLIKGTVSGFQSGGLSGAANGAVDSVKNMKNGLFGNGSASSSSSSIVPPTLNNRNNQIDTIGPQRTQTTTNNNYSIGKYLKSCQQYDFASTSSTSSSSGKKSSGLSTGSKVALGALGVVGGLYAMDKIVHGLDKASDFIKSKLPGNNATSGGNGLKASTVSDNTSFNKEFLNDNKGIADTYTVDKSRYINNNGDLDTASMNRDQAFLTKQFNNELDNYKNHMKIADPDRYAKISSSESFARSAKMSSSFDKLKNIPKSLKYGGLAAGGALLYSKMKSDNRR